MVQSVGVERNALIKGSFPEASKAGEFNLALESSVLGKAQGRELGKLDWTDDDPKTSNPVDRGDDKDDNRIPIDKIGDILDSDTPIVDGLISDEKVSFERDTRRNADDEESDKPEDQHVVQNALEELLESDPEFAKAFNEAMENGIRVNFRLNGDDSRASIVNGDVLQIDIPSDADVKSALKEVFNEDSDWDVIAPGKGPDFEEVMADKDMSGEEFIDNMERLGIFSFSGEHGDKIRKDVIYMYDNSNFMKKVMRSTLEETNGEKKFNFSTIGQGGGTISTPFDDYATTVNAHDAYEGIETGDYESKDHLGNVGLMAHEMMHSFLGIGDKPTIGVGGAVVSQELHTKPGASRVTYDEEHKGAPIDIHEGFDAESYIEKVRGGALDDLSMDELLDEVDGVSVGPASLKDDDEFDDQLNSLVETIRDGVDVEDLTTLYMEGDLAEQYKLLLDYNITHGDYDNWQDLHEDTKEQFMDRLGNFSDEANVFDGYLKRHGGEEQLQELSYETWRSDNHLVPREDLIQGNEDFNHHLNDLSETILESIDVSDRKTLYVEGELADKYKDLLEYNLVHGGFDSYEDLSKYTRNQLIDRLGDLSKDKQFFIGRLPGSFSAEVDVFIGYLKRHGGNEQLDDLAKQVWQESGL